MSGRHSEDDNGVFLPCSPEHVGTLYVHNARSKSCSGRLRKPISHILSSREATGGMNARKVTLIKQFIEWKLFANEEFIVGRNSSAW